MKEHRPTLLIHAYWCK